MPLFLLSCECCSLAPGTKQLDRPNNVCSSTVSRKSYILLKQQFNEIEDLKKEMDLLRAELDNVKNGILHSVKQTLEENGIPVDNKDVRG